MTIDADSFLSPESTGDYANQSVVPFPVVITGIAQGSGQLAGYWIYSWVQQVMNCFISPVGYNAVAAPRIGTFTNQPAIEKNNAQLSPPFFADIRVVGWANGSALYEFSVSGGGASAVQAQAQDGTLVGGMLTLSGGNVPNTINPTTRWLRLQCSNSAVLPALPWAVTPVDGQPITITNNASSSSTLEILTTGVPLVMAPYESVEMRYVAAAGAMEIVLPDERVLVTGNDTNPKYLVDALKPGPGIYFEVLPGTQVTNQQLMIGAYIPSFAPGSPLLPPPSGPPGPGQSPVYIYGGILYIYDYVYNIWWNSCQYPCGYYGSGSGSGSGKGSGSGSGSGLTAANCVRCLAYSLPNTLSLSLFSTDGFSGIPPGCGTCLTATPITLTYDPKEAWWAGSAAVCGVTVKFFFYCDQTQWVLIYYRPDTEEEVYVYGPEAQCCQFTWGGGTAFLPSVCAGPVRAVVTASGMNCGSGSGSGSGSGGGVSTSCCPGVTIPSTLHFTFSAGPACLNGRSLAAPFNPATGRWEASINSPLCSETANWAMYLACASGVWTLTVGPSGGICIGNGGAASSANCTGPNIVFTGITVYANCGGGTVTVTVTP